MRRLKEFRLAELQDQGLIQFMVIVAIILVFETMSYLVSLDKNIKLPDTIQRMYYASTAINAITTIMLLAALTLVPNKWLTYFILLGSVLSLIYFVISLYITVTVFTSTTPMYGETAIKAWAVMSTITYFTTFTVFALYSFNHLK